MSTVAWNLADNLPKRGDAGKGAPVSIETLFDYGVVHVEFPADSDPYEAGNDMPPFVMRMKKQMKFDEVKKDDPRPVPADDAGDDEWKPHLHTSPEVHMVTKGTLYVDIASKDSGAPEAEGSDKAKPESWIRIRVTAGQLIVLMPGIVHRTTVANDSDGPVVDAHLYAESAKESWATHHAPDSKDFAADAVRKGYVESSLRDGKVPRETVLAPANDGDNLFVHHEAEFDATMAKAVRAMRPVRQAEDICVVYFTGAHNPLSHRSWCPDCWDGDTAVLEGVAAVRAFFPGRIVTFVQVSLQRTSFLNNQDNFYRKHSWVKLKAVPSLIVFSRGSTDKFDDDAGFPSNVQEIWRQNGTTTQGWLLRLQGADKVKEMLKLPDDQAALMAGVVAPGDDDEPGSPPRTPDLLKKEESVATASETIGSDSAATGYLKSHGVHETLTKLLGEVVSEKPEDPLVALHEKLGAVLQARKKKE